MSLRELTFPRSLGHTHCCVKKPKLDRFTYLVAEGFQNGIAWCSACHRRWHYVLSEPDTPNLTNSIPCPYCGGDAHISSAQGCYPILDPHFPPDS